MALTESAHRRIARHRADLLTVEADQGDRRTQPGRRGCRLGAGMTAAHHDDVEFTAHAAHLGACSTWNNEKVAQCRLSAGASLADAESPEQGVEHVLDTGPSGHPVERGRRLAQRFSDDERIAGNLGFLQPVKAVLKHGPMAGIDRDLTLRRQERPGSRNQESDEIIHALAGRYGYG